MVFAKTDLLLNRRVVPALCALSMLSTPTGAADGQDATWPQWRGPTRDTRVAAETPWPGNLADLQRMWRMELGPSYSGPIVSKDRVFVTETRDKRLEVVRALDRETGKQLWETSWAGAMSVPFFARSNGDWIRSTPAFDEDSLYVAGMRDVLVCLDAKTGDERWRIDFVDHYGTPLPSFGFVSSPLIDGGAVYVQAAGSVVKIDKKTGDILWRTLESDGGMMDSAFSSPIMATLDGVRQLIVQTRQELAGVSPESGKVLWHRQVPSFRGMNILTPTVYENGILTSTYKNATYFFTVDQANDGWSVDQTWTDKAKGYMSSPVVIDHHGYLHLGNGRLACFDLRDGQQAWRSKSMGKYWSMVSNRDRILALNEEGELLLIRANPDQFELMDRRTIADAETWGHLAVAANQVFVRELKAVAAYRWNERVARQ